MGVSATETLVQSEGSSKRMIPTSAAHQGGGGKGEALGLGSDRAEPAHGLPPHREKNWQRWFELPEAKLLPKTSLALPRFYCTLRCKEERSRRTPAP